jgi:hypothetical protein
MLIFAALSVELLCIISLPRLGEVNTLLVRCQLLTELENFWPSGSLFSLVMRHFRPVEMYFFWVKTGGRGAGPIPDPDFSDCTR